MSNIEIIKDEKFKGIQLSVNFIFPIDKAIIANSIVWVESLCKINSKYENDRVIDLELANLYNSSITTVNEKIGDLYNIEFKINCLNSKYIPENEKVFKKLMNIFNDVLYNPKVIDGHFDKNIIERQKECLINILKRIDDDKRNHAVKMISMEIDRGEPSQNYLYTDIETIKNVDEKTAYEAYKYVLENAEVKVILAGNVEDYMIDEINNSFKESKKEYKIISSRIIHEEVSNKVEEKEMIQSIYTMGFKFKDYNINNFYKCCVMNYILGQNPNSKLFLNVREKNGLAYNIFSIYKKVKGEIIIFAGINADKVDKVREVIDAQIEEMKKGNVTKMEIQMAKMCLMSEFKSMQQDIDTIVKNNLDNTLLYGKDFKYEEIVKMLMKVTKKDIVEMANTITLQATYFLKEKNNGKDI